MPDRVRRFERSTGSPTRRLKFDCPSWAQEDGSRRGTRGVLKADPSAHTDVLSVPAAHDIPVPAQASNTRSAAPTRAPRLRRRSPRRLLAESVMPREKPSRGRSLLTPPTKGAQAAHSVPCWAPARPGLQPPLQPPAKIPPRPLTNSTPRHPATSSGRTCRLPDRRGDHRQEVSGNFPRPRELNVQNREIPSVSRDATCTPALL